MRTSNICKFQFDQLTSVQNKVRLLVVCWTFSKLSVAFCQELSAFYFYLQYFLFACRHFHASRKVNTWNTRTETSKKNAADLPVWIFQYFEYFQIQWQRISLRWPYLFRKTHNFPDNVCQVNHALKITTGKKQGTKYASVLICSSVRRLYATHAKFILGLVR